MSQMGSCQSPGSRLSFTTPRRDGAGREDGNPSALRTLIQGMPMFALGAVVTLLSSYFETGIGKALANNNPSAANFFFAPTDMLAAYSLLALFSSSLASITFRRKLPRIASCFEDITVVSFASTFASHLCILTPVQHHRVVFSVCMIPLLVLDGSPCMLLFRCFNWILRKIQHQAHSSTRDCY